MAYLIHSETYQARRERISTYWWNKASDLRASAGALWYCDQNGKQVAVALGLGAGFSMSGATWPVYRMLCGMALELALKAVALSKGKKVIQTHDLVRLAKHAGGIRFTDREKKLLALLTESIYWDGRYPVPSKGQSMDKLEELFRTVMMRPSRKKGVGTLKFLSPVRPDPLDWIRFQKLWFKALTGYIPATE